MLLVHHQSKLKKKSFFVNINLMMCEMIPAIISYVAFILILT